MVDREDLANLGYGDVVRYRTHGGLCYFIVKKVEDGGISGQIASPIGVNSISIEELLKKDNLEIIHKHKKSNITIILINSNGFFKTWKK